MAKVTDSIQIGTPHEEAAEPHHAQDYQQESPESVQGSGRQTERSAVRAVSAPGADAPSADTIAPDTVAHDTTYVIVLDPPAAPPSAGRPREAGSTGMSWVLTALLLLFVIVAVRFRNNSKYLGALLRSAVEVRERGNVFDDTVREMSFMIVLNAMWSICAGILLHILAGGGGASTPLGMGKCIGLAVAYEFFMILCYETVGTVFSDRLHTRMWVRGYLAATGLTTLVLFPAALLGVCYPEEARLALWMGLSAFIIGKIVFISKGFRIFFTRIGAWVLFLYYLCSLEIVPLVLLYVVALKTTV